ncbi:MAG: outer membrane beta-barrel protein [Deltaproteobacteria bacterium]|nr:outer membrane beta-barrel protein [Deltaproteobacteria bacterium]MDZ4224813.1 outer membrane beta-barrel protein [bacterium]
MKKNTWIPAFAGMTMGIFGLLCSAYNPSFAQDEKISGGFEAFGNIVAGAGWQHHRIKGAVTSTVARDVNGTIPGPIGAYSQAITINREDEFKFFLDQFELDLAKSFGENIRIRGDLDFGSGTLNSGPRFANATGVGGQGSNVIVEQAYATANFLGAEFLLGRFNVPIGFEKVDVIYNFTISRSEIYRALRPNTFTGAKVYYAFSDLVDWHVYASNNGSLAYDNGGLLPAGGFQNTDIPAFGTRLGFNWGEEGKRSTFGFSGVVGQDHPNGKTHISFLGDIDWQWWISDVFAFGGEGIYRQIDTTSFTPGQRKNGKYFGGLANFHWLLSDVFNLNLRYAYTNDANGPSNAGVLVVPITSTTGTPSQSLTGARQQIHEAALDGQYAIAEGAYFRVELDYNYIGPQFNASQQIFGVAGVLAYEF